MSWFPRMFMNVAGIAEITSVGFSYEPFGAELLSIPCKSCL